MTIVLNGTTGITNDGGYTGDGVSFADTTPANTLVTTTGGNVGIGVSSPNNRLDIRGASSPQITLNNTSASANDTTDVTLATYGGSTPYWSRLNYNASQHIWKTYNTERMRVDSSGNIYVGADTTCNLTDFRSKSLGANGYQKLAGGMIIQWGYYADTGTTQTISYPITFPNAVFSVQIQMVRDSVNYQNTTVATDYQSSTTSFTMRWDSAADGVTWIAIGY